MREVGLQNKDLKEKIRVSREGKVAEREGKGTRVFSREKTQKSGVRIERNEGYLFRVRFNIYLYIYKMM